MVSVELIDDDANGGDNWGSDGGLGGPYDDTDENGQASVRFTVSMYAGDNYRASASCLEDAIEQTKQTDADALSTDGGFEGYQVPVFWSPMLTVWRKLHISQLYRL